MKDWEKFENKMYEQVAEIFKNYDVIVEKLGKSDSTLPDIKITKEDGNVIFLETKMPKAQTSQFVVIPENNRFLYSTKNKYPFNEYAGMIISELNKNPKYFDVRQNQIIVDISNEIASKWIISNMKSKRVDYIITESDKNESSTFPIEKIADYFSIKTTLRRKKSGSRTIPESKLDDFIICYKNKFCKEPIIKKKNGKIFVEEQNEKSKYIESDNLKLGSRYFFDKSDKNNLCQIKVTGSTNNPNIIFEIMAKNVEFIPLQYLIEYILNN